MTAALRGLRWTSDASTGGASGNGAWVVQINTFGAVPLPVARAVDVLGVCHAPT